MKIIHENCGVNAELNERRLSQFSSLETQGQIVGAEGKSKRAGKYGTKKVKNGEKSPWGQCLTRQVPNGRCYLASDWCQKTFVFFCPIRRRNGGDRLELVW